MKKNYLKILGILGALSLSIPTFAAKLEIKNENNKELTVYIQAEGAVTEDLHWIERVIPANSSKTITVTKEEMGEKNTFFVRGRTNPLTPRGTCEKLNVDKDYQLTFKDLNIGTECTKKEI